jgi:hypothetical protein
MRILSGRLALALDAPAAEWRRPASGPV